MHAYSVIEIVLAPPETTKQYFAFRGINFNGFSISIRPFFRLSVHPHCFLFAFTFICLRSLSIVYITYYLWIRLHINLNTCLKNKILTSSNATAGTVFRVVRVLSVGWFYFASIPPKRPIYVFFGYYMFSMPI